MAYHVQITFKLEDGFRFQHQSATSCHPAIDSPSRWYVQCEFFRDHPVLSCLVGLVSTAATALQRLCWSKQPQSLAISTNKNWLHGPQGSQMLAAMDWKRHNCLGPHRHQVVLTASILGSSAVHILHCTQQHCDRRRAGLTQVDPRAGQQARRGFTSQCNAVARLGAGLQDVDTPALLVDLDGGCCQQRCTHVQSASMLTHTEVWRCQWVLGSLEQITCRGRGMVGRPCPPYGGYACHSSYQQVWKSVVTIGALTDAQQQQQQLSCAMQAARLSMSCFHELQQLQGLRCCVSVLTLCSI